MKQITVATVIGSLRKASFNRQLFKEAQRLAPQNVKLVEIDYSDVPVYNEDLESSFPQSVTKVKGVVKKADAVLFLTPEYNYSIPGPLKNIIDWASRPYGDSAWNGKPVAVAGATMGGLGTSRAQYHLRQSFVFLNMKPVQQPEVFVSAAYDAFNEKGELKNEQSQAALKQLLEKLAQLTKE